jgi:hypothetical protein
VDRAVETHRKGTGLAMVHSFQLHNSFKTEKEASDAAMALGKKIATEPR